MPLTPSCLKTTQGGRSGKQISHGSLVQNSLSGIHQLWMNSSVTVED